MAGQIGAELFAWCTARSKRNQGTMRVSTRNSPKDTRNAGRRIFSGDYRSPRSTSCTFLSVPSE
jgi:hypothetical protein